MSHPLRMRGLKPELYTTGLVENTVASFADAWIETSPLYLSMISMASHPLRMRGLKQIHMYLFGGVSTVASFADAWIETKLVFNVFRLFLSHPLRMRGLKLLTAQGNINGICRILCGCVD